MPERLLHFVHEGRSHRELLHQGQQLGKLDGPVPVRVRNGDHLLESSHRKTRLA